MKTLFEFLVNRVADLNGIENPQLPAFRWDGEKEGFAHFAPINYEVVIGSQVMSQEEFDIYDCKNAYDIIGDVFFQHKLWAFMVVIHELQHAAQGGLTPKSSRDWAWGDDKPICIDKGIRGAYYERFRENVMLSCGIDGAFIRWKDIGIEFEAYHREVIWSHQLAYEYILYLEDEGDIDSTLSALALREVDAFFSRASWEDVGFTNKYIADCTLLEALKADVRKIRSTNTARKIKLAIADQLDATEITFRFVERWWYLVTIARAAGFTARQVFYGTGK